MLFVDTLVLFKWVSVGKRNSETINKIVFFQSPFVGMLRRKSLLLSYGTLQHGKEEGADNMVSRSGIISCNVPKLAKYSPTKRRKLTKLIIMLLLPILKLYHRTQKKIPQEIKNLLSCVRFDAIKGKKSRVL